MGGLLLIVFGSMVGLSGLHGLGFMLIVIGIIIWMFDDG